MKRLCEEVAYLAYYLHWPRDEILRLEHAERRLWLDEVVNINRRINEESE